MLCIHFLNFFSDLFLILITHVSINHVEKISHQKTVNWLTASYGVSVNWL